ncbi:hypothetical protein [Thermococcus sp.]|uniref:hypothetical protein n=1 Tax=Thermococcus sp. TaxID=35749 RepID=UPI0025E3B8F1|nr:hypothetical protein [Thermococcus sp.]
MRKVYAVVLVLVVLSFTFYFGNFFMARPETHTSARTGSMKSVNATFNDGFCVYPDSPLGKMVAEELRGRGYKVLLLSAPVECDGQFLAVWVKWFNVSYSPVLARGHVRVIAVYSSAGDPTHYLRYRNATDGTAALMDFEDTQIPQFQAYVLVDVSDESRGIIGLRGYQDYLMREAAKAVVGNIKHVTDGEAG